MLKNMLALLNGYFFSPENQVVSHCPDAPAHDDDYFLACQVDTICGYNINLLVFGSC